MEWHQFSCEQATSHRAVHCHPTLCGYVDVAAVNPMHFVRLNDGVEPLRDTLSYTKGFVVPQWVGTWRIATCTQEGLPVLNCKSACMALQPWLTLHSHNSTPHAASQRCLYLMGHFCLCAVCLP
jgi:hypothetical protein